MYWVIERMKLNLKVAAHFKKSTLIQIAGMILNDLFWVGSIFLIFYNLPSFYGMSVRDYLQAYGFFLASMGLSTTVFGGLKNGFESIVEGKMERYLTRPASPLLQLALRKIQPDSIGDFLLGITVLAVSGASPRLIALLPFGFALYTLVWITTISAYFFINDTTQASRNAIFFGITSFSHWPSFVLPDWLKPLPYVILPGAMASFYPVKIAKGEASLIPLLLVLTLHAILALLLWKEGLKRYMPRTWMDYQE